MKRETNVHRRTWFDNHGDIPVEEDGRAHHIHHVDRDRSNNDLGNLKVLSPLDHFKEHLDAKEYQAAHAIYIKYLTDEERKQYEHLNVPKLAANERDNSKIGFNNPKTLEAAMKSQRKRIKEGTFHLQGGEIQRKSNAKRLREGTHNFTTDENRDRTSERNQRLLEEGIHPFQKLDRKKIQNKRVASGKHHFLSKEHSDRVRAKNKKDFEEGNLAIVRLQTCVHCGYEGKGFGFNSKHNDYCESNPNSLLEECKYCYVKRHPSIIKRYHNDKCKSKK